MSKCPKESPLSQPNIYIYREREIPLRIEPLGKNRGHRMLRRTGIGRTQQRPVHQISPCVSRVQSSTVVSASTEHVRRPALRVSRQASDALQQATIEDFRSSDASDSGSTDATASGAHEGSKKLLTSHSHRTHEQYHFSVRCSNTGASNAWFQRGCSTAYSPDARPTSDALRTSVRCSRSQRPVLPKPAFGALKTMKHTSKNSLNPASQAL
jgi:hypothetical protein